ncbi:MAG TPA: serine/threonine-protein kinase [Kofleriaceae bacterium]|nr:serine/threonine-protein kinase [Kofleriaceae bacterium]
MTDDGNAPTIPDTQAPTHGPSSTGVPRAPDARYTLRTLLGRGGMGEVWLAHDVRIDREIAIKLMRGGSGDDEAVARFLREARVQGRLEHPSVVPVHDLGGDDSSPFFAMKRLTGTTLADVIAARDEEKWPRRTLLTRFVDVCLAVEFAHKRGVIHRDLKPANIMLGDFGETYVLDWGLARIRDDQDSGAIRTSDLRGDSAAGQTQAGALLGTPGYMPPEQMRGEPIDQRADVYALGCILFELLAGEPAIARDRTFELTLSVPCHRPLDRRPDVPPELDEICARATQADLGRRLASARELADAVQRFLDGDRDLERRRELAAEHARRAQDLLVADTIEARADAMREAGSAIALDAGNRDAQAVLARLLLEPPKQIPPAALHKLEAEREASVLTTCRLGAVMYTGFLALVPIAKALGIAQSWPLLVLAAELVALIAVTGLAGTRRVRMGRPIIVAILSLHVGLLATIGMFLGPLLLLPILVFGSLPIMVTSPAIYMPKTIVAAHSMAVAVPLALEWLHIMPESYRFVGGGLVLDPWAVDITPAATIFALLTTMLAQAIANVWLLDRQRRDQERAQELLHVQKWQLEQLVPSSGSLA